MNLRFLPLKFIPLTLSLENSPSYRVLGLLLLSVKEIFCLFSRHEQRLTNGVGFFQFSIAEQLKFSAILEPAIISTRVTWDSQWIDFVSDHRTVLVQCQLITINIFCFTLILNINLQFKTNFFKLVFLIPR
jgi:hypothetical protein